MIPPAVRWLEEEFEATYQWGFYAGSHEASVHPRRFLDFLTDMCTCYRGGTVYGCHAITDAYRWKPGLPTIYDDPGQPYTSPHLVPSRFGGTCPACQCGYGENCPVAYVNDRLVCGRCWQAHQEENLIKDKD